MISRDISSIKSRTVESKWEKQGPSYYGYLIWHSSTLHNNRLETKTLILHPDFTPLTGCRSDFQIPNISNLLLSINGVLNIGKFSLSPNGGEIYFSISVNKILKDKVSIQKDLQLFEVLSQRTIANFLPRILFAIGRISLNELQRIYVSPDAQNKKIRKPRAELIFMITYLSCKAIEVSERHRPEQNVLKMKENAEFFGKNEANHEWMLKIDENRAQSSLINLIKANGLDPSLKRIVDLVRRQLLGNQDIKIEHSQSQEVDREFRDFADSFKRDSDIISLERSTVDQDVERTPDKLISSRFIPQTPQIDSYFLMQTPRLCTLSVISGVFKFEKGLDRFSKKCNLLAGRFDGEDVKMAEPLTRILDYFFTSPDAYHENILPHYRKLEAEGTHPRSIEETGFYCEFNKHGTVENFLNFKRETARLFLLIIRDIVNSQIYLFKKHKMIHTDISLYNVYITRCMRPKVGFLNKVYIVDYLAARGVMKTKYQAIVDYWKTLVKPSNYVYCPAEVLQSKGIGEKSVVFTIGALIMQHILETKPRIKKKNYETQILEKQLAGTFSMNFMPADEAAKGPIETFEPLRVFAQACLDADPAKRPTLVELGVFLLYCQKSLDYTYT